MDERPEYKETPGACVYCGNSPVPHRATWVVKTVDVWQNAAVGALLHNGVCRGFARFVRSREQFVERPLFALMRQARLIRFAHDPARAATYRSQVIWEEAVRRGIPMEQVVFLGHPSDVYRARIGGTWFYFDSLPIPPAWETRGDFPVDDKFALKKMLAAQGIPAVVSICVSSTAGARRAFLELGGSVITKPRLGSRGRHTTTAITSEQDVEKGFALARQLGRYVVVEPNIAGSVCRATVVDGKLVGFFEGQPPRILGDGVSSIRQLVERNNATRHERVSEIILTQEHLDFLARCGYSLDSVPPRGAKVALTHRTGRLFGGETRELLSSVHPKLKEYTERAARALDVAVVGFDLIIPDPERDPDEQAWSIIEANGLPYIDLHYLPLYGEPSRTAEAVWDLWGDVLRR